MHASLVMMDKETDSYWPIMEGVSIAGEMEGQRLQELPLGEKAQWKDWVAKHPNTKVLSVDDKEHVENNPYDNYFKSDEGFRGVTATDDRLPTKEPIYAFHHKGTAYAVPFSVFEGGATVKAGDRQLFLYRPAGVEIFYSTLAFSGTGFEQSEEGWRHAASGAVFDPNEGTFVDGEGVAPRRLDGFDTFWFNWSMNNPKTKIVGE